MARGKAALRAIRAPRLGGIPGQMSGECAHRMKFEEIDQGNFTTKTR